MSSTGAQAEGPAPLRRDLARPRMDDEGARGLSRSDRNGSGRTSTGPDGAQALQRASIDAICPYTWHGARSVLGRRRRRSHRRPAVVGARLDRWAAEQYARAVRRLWHHRRPRPPAGSARDEALAATRTPPTAERSRDRLFGPPAGRRPPAPPGSPSVWSEPLPRWCRQSRLRSKMEEPAPRPDHGGLHHLPEERPQQQQHQAG